MGGGGCHLPAAETRQQCLMVLRSHWKVHCKGVESQAWGLGGRGQKPALLSEVGQEGLSEVRRPEGKDKTHQRVSSPAPPHTENFLCRGLIVRRVQSVCCAIGLLRR